MTKIRVDRTIYEFAGDDIAKVVHMREVKPCKEAMVSPAQLSFIIQYCGCVPPSVVFEVEEVKFYCHRQKLYFLNGTQYLLTNLLRDLPCYKLLLSQQLLQPQSQHTLLGFTW